MADTVEGLVKRLRDDAEQLRKMRENARFGGDHTYVRVANPEFLLAELDEAASALEALVVERDEALTHVEVLQSKIDPDEHCACGYDAGTDVCLHHSPIVHALEARALAAEAQRDKAIEALREISCPHQTLDLLWWQTRARSTLNEIAKPRT